MLPRGWRAAAMIAAATLGLGGPTSDAGSSRPPPGVDVDALLEKPRVVSRSATTRVVVTAPELQAAVSHVLAGLHWSFLPRVRVGAPPAGFSPARGGPLPANALWVYVDAISADARFDRGSRTLKGLWEAELLAGAVHDIAVARRLPPVVGFSVQPVSQGWASGDCCLGRELPWRSSARVLDPPPAALRADLTARVERSGLGLEVRSIVLLRPLGPAVEVRLTVDSRTADDRLRGKIRKLFEARGYDGVFLKLYNPAGTLLDSYGTVARTRTTLGTVPGSGAVSSWRLPGKLVLEALLAGPPFVAHPVRTRIDAEPPALRATIERVLAGIDSSLIREVRIESPPAGKTTGLPTTAVWLSVDAVARNARAGMVKAEWEAELVAGAVRDIAALRGLPEIAGVTIRFVRPDGAPAACCASREHTLFRRSPVALPDARPAEVEAALRAAGAGAGLALGSISVLQPLGLAFEVRLTLDSPSWLAAVRAERALRGRNAPHEGLLLRVYDRSGALACVHAYAARTGTRSSWEAPDCRLRRPGHGVPSGWRVVTKPTADSVSVCPPADTRLAPSVTGGQFHICETDRSAEPLASGRPLYCTAHLLGGSGRSLTVELLREGVSQRAVTLPVMVGNMYETATVAAPESGAWECRVLVDSSVTAVRAFTVAP